MIIERYLLREVGQAFVAVFGVLLLIFVSNRFVRYLAEAAAGDLAGDLILRLLVVKIIANLVLILPLAMFVAVLLAFGRLYNDSEVTAMIAGGISQARFLWAIAGLSLGFAVLGLVLATYVTPRAHVLGDEIEQQAEESSEITGIVSGRFKAFNQGERVFYTREVGADRTSLAEVFVHMRDRERPLLVMARKGRQMIDPRTGDRFMVMEDGHGYEGEPGDLDVTVTQFREYGVRVRENLVGVVGQRLNQIPTSELLGSDRPDRIAELQWRLSLPLSLALLGPLGVLLAKTTPRRGRFGKLFYGVLIYFVYNNLLGVSREFVRSEELSPSIGVWPVHLAMVCLIVGLYLHQTGTLRRLARWRIRGEETSR